MPNRLLPRRLSVDGRQRQRHLYQLWSVLGHSRSRYLHAYALYSNALNGSVITERWQDLTSTWLRLVVDFRWATPINAYAIRLREATRGQRLMFNLLVKAGGWDNLGQDCIDRDRLFEYTAQHLASRFEADGEIDAVALRQLPTLLMPETWKYFGDDQLARVVTITDLQIHRDVVTISYVFDIEIPPLVTDTIVERLTSKWGLGRFETTRTHWAIKDGDLYRSLIPILVEDATTSTTTSDATSSELPLDHLRNSSSIEEHLARINPNDPPQAISACKSLIEATIKHVLEELGEHYDERADIPSLTKQVQRSLKVHPDTIAPTVKGRETIVRILGSLSQVSVGVAELRNEYGMDHGRTRSSRGLDPRHSGLAFGAAQTLCRFLLETLALRQSGGQG